MRAAGWDGGQQISSTTLDARRRESPIGEDRCERARMGNGRGGDGGVDESIIRIRIVRVDVRSRTTSAQEDTRWNRLSRFLSRSCPDRVPNFPTADLTNFRPDRVPIVSRSCPDFFLRRT